MATTSTVKRALAALAARTNVERGPYVAVIDEAEAALADLDRAAGFVDSVGLDRLEAAIETAESTGDAASAERGTAALEAYRTYQRAAAGRLNRSPSTGEAAAEFGDGGRVE
ncbi:MAG: hypothetical protein ABEH81_10150 [Halopenitus sp.]